MFGLEIALCAGIFYAGKRLYEYLADDTPRVVAAPALPAAPGVALVTTGQRFAKAALAESRAVNQRFALAVTAAGLAVIGTLAFPAAITASVLLVLYNATELLRIAWRKLRDERKVGIEALMLVGMLGCLATQAYILGALSGGVYYISSRLRSRVQNKLREQTARLLAQQPTTVWLVHGDSEIATPLAALKVGDIIAVSSGEIVPIDGIAVAGRALLDQRSFTGEAKPVAKKSGDHVLAGALVLRGRIWLRVDAMANRTAVAVTEQLMRNTTSYARTLEQRGEAFADATVYPTFGIATTALILHGPIAGLTVLSANFASLFRLTLPGIMLNHLKLAAERRILVKDGRSLDLINRVNMVVFDTTDALTLSVRPEVPELIRRLRARSLEICLLSGDAEEPTRAIATELGIEHYFAELLPVDKARLISELQGKGYSVCLVGDGRSDALAIKNATLSVTLGSAAEIAGNRAQIVLIDDKLLALDELFALGRSYMEIQQASLVTTGLPALLCMGVTVLFPIGFATTAAAYLFSSATSALLVSAHSAAMPTAPAEAVDSVPTT